MFPATCQLAYLVVGFSHILEQREKTVEAVVQKWRELLGYKVKVI
jgi:hypothetical protein